MSIYLKIFLFVILVVVFGYIFFYYADVLLSPNTKQNPENQVCFGSPPAGGCFTVELAKTSAEREKGLMYRTSMDANKGMLFIFDKEDVYPFWMKNTLISLDMIWIDNNYRVVFVAQNIQPCKTLICPVITPTAKAKYVLEINAGISGKNAIKIGDAADLKI